MIYLLLIKISILGVIRCWSLESTDYPLLYQNSSITFFKENRQAEYAHDCFQLQKSCSQNACKTKPWTKQMLLPTFQRAEQNEQRMLKIVQKFGRTYSFKNNWNPNSYLFKKWVNFIKDLKELLYLRNKDFYDREKWFDLPWSKELIFRGFIKKNPFYKSESSPLKRFTHQENLYFFQESQKILEVFEEFQDERILMDPVFLTQLKEEKQKNKIFFLEFFFNKNGSKKAVAYFDEISTYFATQGRRYQMEDYFFEYLKNFESQKKVIRKILEEILPNFRISFEQIKQLKSSKEANSFYKSKNLISQEMYGFSIFEVVEKCYKQVVYLILTLEDFLQEKYKNLQVQHEKFLLAHSFVKWMEQEFTDYCNRAQDLLSKSLGFTPEMSSQLTLNINKIFYQYSLLCQIENVIPIQLFIKTEQKDYTEAETYFLNYCSKDVCKQIFEIFRNCFKDYKINPQKFTSLDILEKNFKYY